MERGGECRRQLESGGRKALDESLSKPVVAGVRLLLLSLSKMTRLMICFAVLSVRNNRLLLLPLVKKSGKCDISRMPRLCGSRVIQKGLDQARPLIRAVQGGTVYGWAAGSKCIGELSNLY
jgi:hypothetical protein